MNHTSRIAACALVAACASTASAGPVPANLVAKVIPVGFLHPWENNVRFMGRVWANKGDEACILTDLTLKLVEVTKREKEEKANVRMECGDLRPLSFNTRNFPRDPITIIRIEINGERLAGVNR